VVRGLAVLNNPSPMEKSCLLLCGSGQCKILRSCRLRYRAISLACEVDIMENSPARRPSDGFPLEFDVSVDGVHDQFPPAVSYTAFDLATTQAATYGQGEVSVKAAVH